MQVFIRLKGLRGKPAARSAACKVPPFRFGAPRIARESSF